MIDLSPLQQYIFNPCDEKHIASFKRAYLAYGFDDCFNNTIDTFMNCEKLSSDGHRLIQTNDYRYKLEVTNALWLIENALREEEREQYYIIVLERHNKNIEFERINGFEYDVTSKEKKNKTKTSKSKAKETNNSDVPKERKETAAERKLKAHVAKINALTFKPKTV